MLRDNAYMNPRAPLAAENLLALVQRMKAEQPLPASSARKAKALAKTLEIHAPDRVVAFLAKVVQLDLAKLQDATEDDAPSIASGLGRRLDWLERVLAAEPASNAAGGVPYKYAGSGAARDKAREVMTAQHADVAQRTQAEDEVLDLELGCLVAYFQLTAPKRQMEGGAELVRALPMVAIALSTVAPIFRVEEAAGEPVSMRDLQPLLFARDEAGAAIAHLDGLGIRRRDLHHAIRVLKEARM